MGEGTTRWGVGKGYVYARCMGVRIPVAPVPMGWVIYRGRGGV
jgi:hypothetical protein